jgi:hypothetical protein
VAVALAVTGTVVPGEGAVGDEEPPPPPQAARKTRARAMPEARPGFMAKSLAGG